MNIIHVVFVVAAASFLLVWPWGLAAYVFCARAADRGALWRRCGLAWLAAFAAAIFFLWVPMGSFWNFWFHGDVLAGFNTPPAAWYCGYPGPLVRLAVPALTAAGTAIGAVLLLSVAAWLRPGTRAAWVRIVVLAPWLLFCGSIALRESRPLRLLAQYVPLHAAWLAFCFMDPSSWGLERKLSRAFLGLLAALTLAYAGLSGWGAWRTPKASWSTERLKAAAAGSDEWVQARAAALLRGQVLPKFGLTGCPWDAQEQHRP